MLTIVFLAWLASLRLCVPILYKETGFTSKRQQFKRQRFKRQQFKSQRFKRQQFKRQRILTEDWKLKKPDPDFKGTG